MNAPVKLNKPRLLIVEDDEGLQRQLRWAYDDYEVLVASDRSAALDLVRSAEPAVVTLDLGLPPDPDGVTEGALFFATDCVIRLGDSGGPVILIEGGQPRLIGLIVGFFTRPKSGGPVGIVVSAQAFAPYVGGGLVSQLFPIDLPPEISMN